MKEVYELRVTKNGGARIFPPDEGKVLSPTGTRKIVINDADPRIPQIRNAQRDAEKRGKDFVFHGWSVFRKYTKKELISAKLFTLVPRSFFEPTGEECGTEYDETSACPLCGAGAEQVTPLFLPFRRIPKSKDFSLTIANEIVVSPRFVELFQTKGMNGASFEPVQGRQGKQAESCQWFQLKINCAPAKLIPPTRAEIDPFVEDEKDENRCSRGDLIGLNRVTEVTISRTSKSDDDIFYSRQYVGVRRGLLRPHRQILVSPRLRSMVLDNKLKGMDFEVAHLREE
jgi:hypothetical protein